MHPTAPSGYFNQTYTVEYTIPGSLDGATLVPLSLDVPSSTEDPQQFYRPEVDGDAGLLDVDYVVNDVDRRGATGIRIINQIWIVSPVAGSPGAQIEIVDAVDGVPIVQEVVDTLGGQTTFFRTNPVWVPQGSLLRISGFDNPGPEPIKVRLTIEYTDDLVAAAQAVCACSGGGGGEIEIQEDGAFITTTGIINFTGAGVTVTDDPGNNRVDVDIPGGGGVELCDSVPEPIVAGSQGSAGTDDEAARCDHEHPVPVGDPVTVVGATNSEGISDELARADHQHRLEVQVESDGVLVGSQPTLNFSGFNVADDAGNNRVDVSPVAVDLIDQVILRLLPANTGVAPLNIGIPNTSNGGVSYPALVTTSLLGSTPRARWTSPVGGGQPAGHRSAVLLWTRGSAAGAGGFYIVFRFALGGFVLGHTGFVGLFSSTAAIPVVEPSTLTDMVGMAFNTTQTQWQLMHNDGAGAAAQIPLGANFNINTTDLLELHLIAAPNAATIDYEARNLSTGAVASGTLAADLPADTVGLGSFAYTNTGTDVTTAAIIDVAQIAARSGG